MHLGEVVSGAKLVRFVRNRNFGFKAYAATGRLSVSAFGPLEVFTAAAERRRQMGRTVRCLHPGSLVGGADTWNPLENLDPNDIYYLHHTARALLPEPSGGNEAAEFFRNKAVDLIVGALWVALHSKTPLLTEVSRLLTDEKAFTAELSKFPNEPAARAALTIMNDDPKTRDPIRATAEQAFSWLSDSRSRDLVKSSSFEVADLADGDVDLFVAIRPRDKATLAPLLRWLLSDIFNTIRDHHPKERLVIFIDEAASLGRFDALLQAASELPGHGASLWTIWQDRGQIAMQSTGRRSTSCSSFCCPRMSRTSNLERLPLLPGR